jgi:type IV secretion system protein VirB5
MLMRRSALLAVPWLLAAHSAWAQAAVVCVDCTKEIPEMINRALVAANWITQLDQMRQHYQQLIITAESLKHLSPQSLETATNLLSNEMRSPGSPSSAMPGLNFGSDLSGYGQPFYNQNHYYTPNGDDFAAQEMQRRQYATANLQGEAQAGMDRAAERIASLSELEDSIRNQPDVTAVSAIDARINAEHMYLANETNNMQRLQLLQQTQARVDQQRAEQHGRKEAEDWAAAVAGQAWGN